MRSAGGSSGSPSLARSWHGSLFRKYVLTLVSLVALVLAINAAVETWFLYRETMDKVARAQAEYAAAASVSVEDALAEIERQVSWVTRASAQTLAQHRDDYDALLEQSPIVMALAFVDGEGRERIRARRADSPDLAALGDLRLETERRGFGPAAFHEGALYADLVIPHSGVGAGTTIARVRLAGLAGSVPPSTAGTGSYAYLIDAEGRILARSEPAPLAVGDRVAPPEAEREGAGSYARDAAGRPVLATALALTALPAWILVEQPLNEALSPLRDLLVRLAWLLAVGLVVAISASLLLARRMLVPIRALHAGAENFAANRFEHRIAVRTGDEFEVLATRFNDMADALATSYTGLESEIRRQTRDLARSVSELRALEETGRAIVASLRLDDVVEAVATRATALAGAEAGAVYLAAAPGAPFRLAGGHQFPAALARGADTLPADLLDRLGDGSGEAVLVSDLSEAAWLPAPEGFRAAALVPLAEVEGPLGLILLLARVSSGFPTASENVLHTFAHQAALAIRNARLFEEVDEKGRQLAAADMHKTQFFANMSHELRTPLNAVLGYSELLADGLYGPLSEKACDALERIQINGRHLLSLINDVLDFTKIEAGLLTLSLQDYALGALIESVAAAAASLAEAKGLGLEVEVAPGLPIGQGDERRLTQVLMNLVGNAIKFTDAGSVRIGAAADGDAFVITVADTGPGIAPADQARIFDEFQQVDSSSTRRQGGTGLGLSITRRLVLLHGGRIEVESEIGHGAVFRVVLPIRAQPERQAA
ncbi:HAMP domain-containing sensor histidine kinase [Methylobacterium sp. A54F]